MSCETYRELISADLDGELSPAEETVLLRHLSDCDDCRGWRRDQMTIREEFHRWPEEELVLDPPHLSAVRAARRVYRVPRALAWAAGILLIIQSAVSITSLISRRGETVDEPTVDNGYVETITLTPEDRTSYTESTGNQTSKTPTNTNGG